MVQYYYDKYNIDYYWDEISTNAILSKTMNSSTVNETSSIGNEITYSNGFNTYSGTWPYYTYYDAYTTIVVSSTGIYNDYELHEDGNHTDALNVTYPEEDVAPGDIFYVDYSEGVIKYQVTEKLTVWNPNWDKYEYTIKIQRIAFLTLNTYTIYKHEQKGPYSSTIVADDGTYPDNGPYFSYWYVKTTKPQVVLNPVGDKTISLDTDLNFQLSASIDGSSIISYSANTLPIGASLNNSTGQFSWVPTSGQDGNHYITFTTTANGTSDSESITITVNNLYPSIDSISNKSVDEGNSLSFNVNTNTPDGGTINCYVKSGLPAGASFDFSGITGSFSWVPDYSQDGTYTIVFEAEANGYYDTEQVIITVNDVAPNLNYIGSKTVDENVNINFSVSAYAPIGAPLIYIINGLPTGASFYSNGVFNWTPTYVQSGTYEITFIADIEGTQDSETITITVNDVIRPATISIPNKSVNEDQTLSFDLDSYINNPDSINLIYGASGLPEGATLNTGTGYFSWKPDYTQGGTYEVTFSISGQSTSDSDTLIITVVDIQRDPFIYTVGNKSVDESENLNFLVEYANPDGLGVTLSVTGLPAGATFDSNTRELSWTPSYNQSGSYNLTFDLTYLGGSDREIITITVNEIHQPPTGRIPIQNYETNDRKPYFEFVLPANYETDSNKYHAKLRVSATTDMSNLVVDLDSKDDQSQWELWDDVNSIWIAFPLGGVNADSKVRARPDFVLNYGLLYWDCASWEINYGYGKYAVYWKLNILISTDKPYMLDVAGITYDAFSLSCSETSNGEIGSINFIVDNSDGLAFQNINDRDTVILAINDGLGNQEQFKGIIKRRKPSGSILQVSVITGDGILSERRIKEDYLAQDIGLTAKQVIDTYCSPLTSSNINTATGISVPIQSDGKTPLQVFEEIRRRHGVYYFVDVNWDMNLYLPSEINQSVVTVRYGD